MTYEQEFMKALFHSPDASMTAMAAQPAFAVYRNTVMKACIDALEANFPTVVRLVGRGWFRAAAAVHVASEPPSDPRLLEFGHGWPRFLAGFEPAAELPYLAAVAHLDWLWTRSHASADANAMQVTELASRTPAELAQMRLRPHPAARWFWCEDHPAYTLWSCNRGEGAALPHDLPWTGEGALLCRPQEGVHWCSLAKAGCVLLDECAQGQTLACAADAAAAADPQTDIFALLVSLIQQGALETTR